MGEAKHDNFDLCMFEGYDIAEDIQDIFVNGGGFKYTCVDTFTTDSLDKYRS